jgi:hypothetical protein
MISKGSCFLFYSSFSLPFFSLWFIFPETLSAPNIFFLIFSFSPTFSSVYGLFTWIYTHPLPPSVPNTPFLFSSLHHFLFPFLSSPLLLLFFFFLFSLKHRERAESDRETWGERGGERFVGVNFLG